MVTGSCKKGLDKRGLGMTEWSMVSPEWGKNKKESGMKALSRACLRESGSYR